MELLTEEIIKAFQAHPLYSQDEIEDPEVLVKYFNPAGAGTWYIIEASRRDEDWLMFGLCCISEPEFGYVLLSQLQEIRIPTKIVIHDKGKIKFARGECMIERDLYFHGTISDAKKELGY